MIRLETKEPQHLDAVKHWQQNLIGTTNAHILQLAGRRYGPRTLLFCSSGGTQLRESGLWVFTWGVCQIFDDAGVYDEADWGDLLSISQVYEP